MEYSMITRQLIGTIGKMDEDKYFSEEEIIYQI